MSTDYNYDEQGQFFPFFILTMSGLVTLPLTYSLLKPSKDIENTAPRLQTSFKYQDAEVVDRLKRKQRRRERKLKRLVAVVIGWSTIAWMIYLISVTARTVPKIWDPYDILGISRSLNEKSIKSHYKRLSLKFHPDKIRPDPAKNETVDSLNEHFVELTKAYKALTDEEVRNNYIQYGHPDGKQSFSIGIALPQFIVTEGNGKYVLLVYGLLLGVLLPYIVGKWWYGTQRITKERVLISSAGNLFREYQDDMKEGDAISTLSSGDEYRELLSGDRAETGLSKTESRVFSNDQSISLLAALSSQDRKRFDRLDSGLRRKVLSLLWAHLNRLDLADSTLNNEKYETAPIAFALNDALLAITLAFGNVQPILSVFKTSQNLIQALPPNAPPLLQLPHFTPEIVAAIEGPDAKKHMSLQSYMSVPDSKRRKLAVRPSLLSDKEYETALEVARQVPALQVEKAFFKVTGERFITPGSLVQFVVKARVIPPGTKNVPDVNELDLEDVDADEGDVDAIIGRKGSKKESKDADAAKSEEDSSEEKKGVQPPLAFAPRFARDHSPRWHVFLSDSKQGKMAVPPFTFTTFDKPLFTEKGTPTFAMQTFKMQFQAPPQAGQYTFVMHVLCDSYISTDTKMQVTMNVDEMARAEELGDEDDISEPDEDSLAGQMNALKSGGAPPPKRKKAAVEEASSDDESDTEGEDAADDTSDTDTDTDTDED